MRKKIRDPTDFEWLKQCRFYWRDDRDTVIISICDVDFEYSFEYLGERLESASASRVRNLLFQYLTKVRTVSIFDPLWPTVHLCSHAAES